MLAGTPSDRPHVVVVGGGGTGGALAHDLVLRGLRVTLLERGEVTSGTTGRHHGLLHSGARYAVSDRVSAVECIEENRILRRIAAGSFEENGGLFVAITDEDLDYLPAFLEGCAACDIPAERMDGDEARRREPGLSDAVRAAVQVPDGTMDAMRLPLRFFATAQANGALVRCYTEVVGLRVSGGAVTGVEYRDDVTGEQASLSADLVVNAAGPWAQRVAAMAGVDVPLRCSPGVLVAVRGRWVDMVVNRLHPSGDGDIVLPQRGLSVIGTSAWVVDDPDELHLPVEHVATMVAEGSRLVPAVATAERRAAWSAVRPLIGGASTTGRELSRTFACFDHSSRDGVDGLVTIAGGKATTLRAMAEATADVVCARLGITSPCLTRDVPLLPHTAYRPRVPEETRRGGHTGHRPRPQHGTGPAPVICRAPDAEVRPNAPTRVLRVQRWKPGWSAPVLVDHEVEVEDGTTLLDALRAVRWHQDPSLTLRHSCCHSSCGTCGMRVNGREVLACTTRLADLPSGPLRVEPLLNAPVVSDLVVDAGPFLRVLGELGRPLVRASEARGTGLRLEDCIECGLCVSACPVCATDPGYLGPAALGSAWRVVAEPRGGDVAAVLARVDDHEGCWRCHLGFACSEICPTGAEPGEGIMRLRGTLVRRSLARAVGRRRPAEVRSR